MSRDERSLLKALRANVATIEAARQAMLLWADSIQSAAIRRRPNGSEERLWLKDERYDAALEVCERVNELAAWTGKVSNEVHELIRKTRS